MKRNRHTPEPIIRPSKVVSIEEGKLRHGIVSWRSPLITPVEGGGWLTACCGGRTISSGLHPGSASGPDLRMSQLGAIGLSITTRCCPWTFSSTPRPTVADRSFQSSSTSTAALPGHPGGQARQDQGCGDGAGSADQPLPGTDLHPIGQRLALISQALRIGAGRATPPRPTTSQDHPGRTGLTSRSMAGSGMCSLTPSCSPWLPRFNSSPITGAGTSTRSGRSTRGCRMNPITHSHRAWIDQGGHLGGPQPPPQLIP